MLGISVNDRFSPRQVSGIVVLILGRICHFAIMKSMAILIHHTWYQQWHLILTSKMTINNPELDLAKLHRKYFPHNPGMIWVILAWDLTSNLVSVLVSMAFQVICHNFLTTLGNTKWALYSSLSPFLALGSWWSCLEHYELDIVKLNPHHLISGMPFKSDI